MSRRLLELVAVAAASAVLTGCSSAGDEPSGLPGPTTTASASAPEWAGSDTPEPTGEPDASPSSPSGGEPEPSPTFTQPFLPPGERSVIDLPAALVIEPPDDATEEERAVLDAAGRFMASWDAVLFGAGDEQSGIFATSADPQLGRLLNYLVESVSKERVIVGEPTVIELRSVSVHGTTAEVDMCALMRNWVQYTGGTPEPQPELERLLLTMTHEGGAWLATDTKQADPQPCE